MMSVNEPAPTLSSWLVFNPRDAQPLPIPRMRGGHRAAIAERLRALAPYAALLALPGGSVMALSLWLYRRQKGTALLATR